MRELQEAYPKVSQPWYSYNAGASMTFTHIITHLENIILWGTCREYFPDLINIILGFFNENLAQAEIFFRRKGLTIFIGIHYLGRYIGDSGL